MRYPVVLLYTIVLYTMVALTSPAFGTDFSFIGAFAQDDERRQFSFTLIQPGTVLIRTWSYAGGVNSTGARLKPADLTPRSRFSILPACCWPPIAMEAATTSLRTGSPPGVWMPLSPRHCRGVPTSSS